MCRRQGRASVDGRSGIDILAKVVLGVSTGEILRGAPHRERLADASMLDSHGAGSRSPVDFASASSTPGGPCAVGYRALSRAEARGATGPSLAGRRVRARGRPGRAELGPRPGSDRAEEPGGTAASPPHRRFAQTSCGPPATAGRGCERLRRDAGAGVRRVDGRRPGPSAWRKADLERVLSSNRLGPACRLYWRAATSTGRASFELSSIP